ncbi:hypothetical protein [Longicatena caecimuris]|uniref:hypothetical protein n=1 Tax=Longicatena caecimuris TaxID=1796635 RepID=UPI0039958FD2
MTEKQKNDVLYVCSLIETIARKTKNHRQDVIRHFTKADIERQLRLAEVNHCLSFEQVSDELIEDLNIPEGILIPPQSAATRFLLQPPSECCTRGWCCPP